MVSLIWTELEIYEMPRYKNSTCQHLEVFRGSNLAFTTKAARLPDSHNRDRDEGKQTIESRNTTEWSR
jgi:hypothetical protein